MSYIGASPIIGNFQKCDAITTSATATFNLLVGGVAVSPETANNCIVSLNGVIQAPTSAYTISGSTIVFDSALTTSDVIDFIVLLGNVLDLGTPSDDTVTAAKLNDTAISGQTALGAEPADTDEFLVSDAGTLKRMDYSYIKGGAKIGQIVSTAKTDTFTTTNASSWTDITGMSVAITPVAATSKILICLNLSGQAKSNNNGFWKMVRDINSGGYADFCVGDAASSRIQCTLGTAVSSSGYMAESMNAMFLDSPTWTTGAITYKAQVQSDSDWQGVNRTYTDADTSTSARMISTITAWEILA